VASKKVAKFDLISEQISERFLEPIPGKVYSGMGSKVGRFEYQEGKIALAANSDSAVAA